MSVQINATVEEFFLIKEDGVCYAHAGEGAEIHDDLKSAMIVAMDYGICEAFKGKIKCITLEDSKRVVYYRYEIRDVKFTIITVISPDFKDFILLQEKVEGFRKFLEDENVFENLGTAHILNPDLSGIDRRITDRIKSFFSIGVEVAVSR